MAETIPEAVGLVKHYPVKTGLFGRREVIHAVDDVSFSVAEGETLGIVGESGCGKSTLAKCLMRLEPPTNGQVFLAGRDVTTANSGELREIWLL